MNQSDASILARIHVLEGLNDKELTKIMGRCDWRRYAPNQLILDRDDVSTDVYFILEGDVRVINFSVLGREVQFASLNVGDHFGDLAAIDGLPRSASVTAASDTLVAVMSHDDFIGVLQRHNSAAMYVLRGLARIIRDSDDRIMDLSTLSNFQRVYSEILRRAKPDSRNPGQWILRPYPPEQDIAGLAGVTRDTVARAVSQLRQAGFAQRKDLNLYIKDRDGIVALIERYRIISGG